MAKNVEGIISISKVREGINFYPALMDNLVYFIILLYVFGNSIKSMVYDMYSIRDFQQNFLL